MALSPEILVPRLGDALVEQGLLSKEQLLLALETQNNARKDGQTPLLGQVLIDMGLIDRPTLDQAITKQILNLQTALQRSNQHLELRVQERTTELEKAYTKLSELTKLKVNFISNISHELRTPMTHVKGYIDLLLNNDFGPLNSEQHEAIEVLKRASERLARLIDDLILFSTAETSLIQINNESFDIKLLASEVIQQNFQSANQKNIRLWLDCSEESIQVYADRDRTRWVINQLIENALKFTSKEGAVFVRLKPTTMDVLICVTDTGIGIESSKIEEVFEPFHQLDGSSTRKQGGTGLGLTLVKKILEAQGSKITVSSIKDKGSKFEFHLSKNEPSE
ncbi:MAG: ATP-binding protein [Chloroflexi bacterium]|nr:ATP-binding protein [Chloroflexota bacterium]